MMASEAVKKILEAESESIGRSRRQDRKARRSSEMLRAELHF